MLNSIKPKIGRLLISGPFMKDPNFIRSVILIAEHNEEGTVGYILNQVGNLCLSDVMEDLLESKNAIYFGGPVEPKTLHFIHCCYDKLGSGDHIGNGIYWGGNFETLKVLLLNNEIKDHEIKFFMGYSGWALHQLEEEIKENSWMVSDVSDTEIVFTNDEDKLWRDVIVNLGPKYAHVSNFPLDPNLN